MKWLPLPKSYRLPKQSDAMPREHWKIVKFERTESSIPIALKLFT